MNKKQSLQVLRGVIDASEKSSTAEFYKRGIESLLKHDLISREDAQNLERLASLKTDKEVKVAIFALGKETKSEFVRATLAPGLIGSLDLLENAASGGENSPTSQASTGAGTAAIIIIGATGAGAAIGTAIGGPPAGTLIGAAVGMLAGGALAAGAVAADGDNAPSGEEGGGEEGGGEEGGGGEATG